MNKINESYSFVIFIIDIIFTESMESRWPMNDTDCRRYKFVNFGDIKSNEIATPSR